MLPIRFDNMNIKNINYIIIFLLFNCFKIKSADLNLIWQPSCDINTIKYILYYTTNKAEMPKIEIEPSIIDFCGEHRPAVTNTYYGKYDDTSVVQVTIVGRTNTICKLQNLKFNTQYYFAVSAVNKRVEYNNTYEIEGFRSNEYQCVLTNKPSSKVNGVFVISFTD